MRFVRIDYFFFGLGVLSFGAAGWFAMFL